jgi:hypothetical protein
MSQYSIYSIVSPVVNAVYDNKLKQALNNSFQQSAKQLDMIEKGFKKFAQKRWSAAINRTFMKSWHSSHLKMLSIYGLTCRLHRLAKQAQGDNRDNYFMAAARNAETSHEDLNLDGLFELNHSQLYDEMANALCEGDEWHLERYNLPPANAFKAWIRDNMVLQDVSTGLLTNMFSEIFNHGEFSYVLNHFKHIFSRHCGFDEKTSARLTIYIKCHVVGNVEMEHFNCCIDALTHLNTARGSEIDYWLAEQLFKTYLDKMSQIMGSLTDLMNEDPIDAALKT